MTKHYELYQSRKTFSGSDVIDLRVAIIDAADCTARTKITLK